MHFFLFKISFGFMSRALPNPNTTSPRQPMRVFSKDESVCCICNDVLWPVIQLKCHVSHVLCATCWEQIVEHTRQHETDNDVVPVAAATHLRFGSGSETESEDSAYLSDVEPENYSAHHRVQPVNTPPQIVARCPFCNTYTEAIILRNARLTMKCGSKTINPDKHDRLCDTCDTTKASRLNALCVTLTSQLKTANKKNTAITKQLQKCLRKYDKEVGKVEYLSDEIVRLTCTDHSIISKRVYDMLDASNLLLEQSMYSASSGEDSSDSDSDSDNEMTNV